MGADIDVPQNSGRGCRSGLAYREKVRPGTGREAGLGHVGEGREQDAEALAAN